MIQTLIASSLSMTADRSPVGATPACKYRRRTAAYSKVPCRCPALNQFGVSNSPSCDMEIKEVRFTKFGEKEKKEGVKGEKT